MAELSWLGAVRHGESVGNVAAERAEASGAEVLDLVERDADVPLTGTGEAQARALGEWFAALGPGQRPEVVLGSPYRRTVQTAQIALGGAVPVRLDERLRDRELGVLDLLTRRGVLARFPAEAARQARLGPFYHRPPGGESWADVALRLRAVLGEIRREYGDQRVLLVTHEAVVLLLRYLIEGLTEPALRELARARLHNASLTSWVRDGDRLRLATFNDTGHLDERGTPATRQRHV